MFIYLRTILRPSCRFLRKYQPIYQQNLRLCSQKTAADTKYYYPLGDSRISNYIINLRQEYDKTGTISVIDDVTHEHIVLLMELFKKFDYQQTIHKQLNELISEMQNESAEEMLKLADEERQNYCKQLLQYDNEIVDSILALNVNEHDDECTSIVLEVMAGVGGLEAMLFTRELYDMYINYIKYKRWSLNVLEEQTSDLGGLRHASILINGTDVFTMLKHEGGVHRVQRIPITEAKGRMQTSTAVVAIMPQMEELNIQLNPKELRIDTKRASGPGGQNVNKLESAVRIVHLPTGISVECQEERTQYQNKALAMKKLYAKLYQKEVQRRLSSEMATRKSQVGSGLRNEKVRSYNYHHGRIVDHRIEDGTGTIHNLEGFLQGNDVLDDFIGRLRNFNKKRKLLEIIEKAQ